MSHYQDRLDSDLAKIRDEIGEIASGVETAVKNAVHATLTRNDELAYATILGDHPINRRVRRLDHDCHAFVARHLPSAGPLRFVSSALRLAIALERVGDYAVAICRELAQMREPIPPTVARDIELLAEQSERILRQAIRAFVDGNAEMARGAMGMADQVNATFSKVFRDLLDEGEGSEHRLRDLFALLVIFNRLERVSDQAKNICEETLFAVSGETKPPKRYRILFVDRENHCHSQIAMAYARKFFPQSGKFDSAGWEPADSLEQRCASFLDRRGYDIQTLHPRRLDMTHDELGDFHVVVSLDGNLRERAAIPYSTVYLEWDLGPKPDALDQERAEELLEELHRDLGHRIGELMGILRGQDAN